MAQCLCGRHGRTGSAKSDKQGDHDLAMMRHVVQHGRGKQALL